MIDGPSGAGKSSLALALMAHGAELVADDRTLLRATPEGLLADAPPGLPALIEARGVGLLPARLTGPVPLRLLVTLGAEPQDRLPPERRQMILGHHVTLIVAAQHIQLAPAVLQILKGFAGLHSG
jgi:HPr kinase/phosphorylase